MEKPRANLTVGHTLLCKCTPDVGLRVGQPSPNEISDPKIKPFFFLKCKKPTYRLESSCEYNVNLLFCMIHKLFVEACSNLLPILKLAVLVSIITESVSRQYWSHHFDQWHTSQDTLLFKYHQFSLMFSISLSLDLLHIWQFQYNDRQAWV